MFVGLLIANLKFRHKKKQEKGPIKFGGIPRTGRHLVRRRTDTIFPNTKVLDHTIQNRVITLQLHMKTRLSGKTCPDSNVVYVCLKVRKDCLYGDQRHCKAK